MAACNYQILQHYCTLDTCCLAQATIHYIPNLAGNALYFSIFAVILSVQLGLGIRSRTWGFLACMIGGLSLELLGYGGRIGLHANPFDFNMFLLYLICLTIGPTFIAAAIYICSARIMNMYGTGVSRLQPRTFARVFIVFDFIALLLQAIGGGMAATRKAGSTDNTGVNVMIAGLAWQVISLVLFMLLCAEMVWRASRPSTQVKSYFHGVRSSSVFQGLLFALVLATITIFIRSVYRIVELQEGFGGKLANEEVPFMLLEGPMMILASTGLTIFHPGLAFKGEWAAAGWSKHAAIARGETLPDIVQPLTMSKERKPHFWSSANTLDDTASA